MRKAEQQSPDVQFDANAQVKLDAAHDLVQHPDKFAEIFVKPAETQTKIKEYVRKEIKESLESDIGTRTAMKGLIAEQFKEDWSHLDTHYARVGSVVRASFLRLEEMSIS
jgi:hypothetical protein